MDSTWLHVLEFVILGLLAWIARTTQTTSVRVAVIAQQIADADIENEDQKSRIHAIEQRLNAADLKRIEIELNIRRLSDEVDRIKK